MRREDVTPKQAAAIKRKIAPMLGYMNKLKKRMNRIFARDDALFAEVIDAADALHKVNVSIHYLSCGKTGDHTAPPSDCFADAKPLLSPGPRDQPNERASKPVSVRHGDSAAR